MESPTKEEKPLTIDKAAFLLLRVRRVFKKKIQTKKEKNYAQDVVFPKTADVPQITTPAKPAKKKGVPPLIRSRTVPAIIVPFSSILQAQLGKTANQAGSHQNKDVVSSSKSDFSTPGVDYVQFLTGSPPPTATSGTSGAYSPALHHRYSVHPGFGHPSLASRDSISGGGGCSAGTASTITGGDCSSWNTSSLAPTSSSSGSGGGTSAHFLSSSDCSLFQPSCSLSGGGGVGGGVGGDGYLQHNSNPFLPSSPHPSSTGGGGSGRTFGRLSRLLNTPVENRRKSSTISLQNWHSSSAAAQAHHQRHHQHQQQPHHHHHTCEIFTSNLTSASEFPNVCWTPATAAAATPRLARRRRSLEAEDLFRSRSVSIDSLLKTHFLDPDGTFKNFNKRRSTGSAHEHAGKNSQEEESLGELLDSMVHEAEKKTENLMARLLKCSTFGSLTSSQLKELEKEFHISEKRYKTLQKLRTDYAQIRVPDPPSKVTVDVIGTTAVRIRIQEGDNPEHSISTKYTIEWSQDEEFTTRTGSLEMVDLRKLETVVNDLVTGHRYYFRVCAGNCKGYGEYKNSTPASVIPSSWRDLDGKKSRYAGKSQIFDDIFIEIQKSRPEYASEIRSLEFPRPSLDTSSATSESGPNSGQSLVNIPSVVINQTPSQAGGGGGGGGGGGQQKSKNQKIISIKQLFAAAPKFQKNFKRGVFLSCVIYSEDKLLVTNEEFLPAIEIDDSFPSSLHNDFHWLLKVASTWEDVKSFKADMEKSGSASTFHFRLKLLQATAVMQTALGVTDLGRLYYKTTRDKDNSVVVITTINYMRSTKMISSLNVRWIPLTKMSSRGKSTDDISDVLINSIQEQILYHQVSNIPVGRGLYLGYLKLASSVDLLKIVVGEKTPNMLPHAKIRDNPHVSNEEWTMIQKLTKSKSLDSLNNLESLGALENPRSTEDKAAEENPGGGAEEGDGDVAGQGPSGSSTEFSEAQQLFRSQLIAALKRLFACLDIDYESSLNHRLYNAEVIEISSSVSLLVIFPPLENVCLVAGQSDKLLQRSDLIPLPVQVFEMIHLSTYQKEFITRYARLSAILEMDTILAQHNQREAFSSSEMAIAKQRMNQLSDLQSKIDSAWKGSRWVIDVVTTSRDKSASSASMRALAQLDPKSSSTESVASTEIPGRKTHNNNNHHHHHHLEENQLSVHSKSDQELVPSGSASGLKFSRSENQLFNFGSGGTAPKNDSSSNASQGHHHHHSSAHHLFNPTAPGVRKVSVPVQSAASAKAIQEKMQFAQNIYSSHSQSDSTISNSSSSSIQQSQQQQASSTSLHNLYRQKSSSQILVPNLIVSDVGGELVSSSSSPGAPSHPLSTPGSPIRNFTPKRTATTTGTTLSETPPPVPPRRTAPPPPPPPVPLRLDQATAAAAAAAPPTEDSRPDSGSSSGSSLVEGTDLYHPSPISVPSVVVIQVYAAYDCGLSEGTSVKLQISNQTTARQVVDLFVRQLNSQVRGKGLEGPIYERTQDFCLVSVVGARERCLRNDFRPLLLQNPWKSGRLYVRKKNEVTAAIDLSSRD